MKDVRIVYTLLSSKLFFVLFLGELSWLLANAEQLPVEDNSVDVYTVAFGIRNMTHIDKVRWHTLSRLHLEAQDTLCDVKHTHTKCLDANFPKI